MSERFERGRIKLNEFQNDSARTMQDDQPDAAMCANYAMGLAGECGEVVNLLKKALYHHHTLDRDALIDELGDVLWYVCAIATHHDIPLEDIACANIQKLEERYPDGFTHDASRNRTC